MEEAQKSARKWDNSAIEQGHDPNGNRPLGARCDARRAETTSSAPPPLASRLAAVPAARRLKTLVMRAMMNLVWAVSATTIVFVGCRAFAQQSQLSLPQVTVTAPPRTQAQPPYRLSRLI
jgi:hypothetical protein